MRRAEHVAIAVKDVDEALGTFERLFGISAYATESVASEGVRTHFLDAGSIKLELLEALDASSPIAGFLERRGPGLHHLAFEVDDLQATYDRLEADGFRLLGAPRAGADGKRIFFVHPKDTAGVLVEFCQSARQPQATGAHPLCISGNLPTGLESALSRWFTLGPGPGPLGLSYRTEAAAVERHVFIDPPSHAAGAGHLVIRIDTPGAADLRLPAELLGTLPDPWGTLARMIAAFLLSHVPGDR